jgi:hypothetical protein
VNIQSIAVAEVSIEAESMSCNEINTIL